LASPRSIRAYVETVKPARCAIDSWSLHVYETAERGWFCFGRCRRGGTIYDLAAPLYGYDSRGEDFLRLRGDLRRLFGLDLG
jgi:hypothetical protein